jgi:mRNA interferase RelE/StbE
MPKADRTRMVAALRQVAAEPSVRQSFVTEMVGQAGLWRLRKGDWRALYRIVDGDVVVDRVGNRRDIYR